MSLYMFGKNVVSDEEYCNYAFDKTTNAVYPILYDELKTILEQGLTVTFEARQSSMRINFSFPDDLKAEINLTHNNSPIDILIRDKNDHVSYNISNINFTG